MKQPVLGVIVGNRGFFPGHLSEKGRETIRRFLGLAFERGLIPHRQDLEFVD